MKRQVLSMVLAILFGTSVYAREISFERPEGYEEMLAKYPKSEANLINLIYESRDALKVSKNDARQERVMNNFKETIDGYMPFEGWIGTICESNVRADGNDSISYTLSVEIANYTVILTAKGDVSDKSKQDAILDLIESLPVGTKVEFSGTLSKEWPRSYSDYEIFFHKSYSRQDLANAMSDFMGVERYRGLPGSNLTEQRLDLLFCPEIILTNLSIGAIE